MQTKVLADNRSTKRAGWVVPRVEKLRSHDARAATGVGADLALYS